MLTAMGETEGDLVAASGDSDGWKLGERAPLPAAAAAAAPLSR